MTEQERKITKQQIILGASILAIGALVILVGLIVYGTITTKVYGVALLPPYLDVVVVISLIASSIVCFFANRMLSRKEQINSDNKSRSEQ
jgi:membrane protein implicated in regulation of membrane protease activity